MVNGGFFLFFINIDGLVNGGVVLMMNGVCGFFLIRFSLLDISELVVGE